MSGFIANAGSGAITDPDTLASDPFWPAVDVAALRSRLRLDDSITAPRLIAAACTAVDTVNTQLDAWRAEQQAAGHDALADVSPRQLGDQPRLVYLYLRAVDGFVGAELAERYRTYDASNSGEHRAEELTPTIDEHRRDARWAIRDLQGLPRATVDLI